MDNTCRVWIVSPNYNREEIYKQFVNEILDNLVIINFTNVTQQRLMVIDNLFNLF